MKRVTHTPFGTPTRSIGRDVELTLALVGALGQAAGAKSVRFHGFIDLIKYLLK
jgi:hypothetical protein